MMSKSSEQPRFLTTLDKSYNVLVKLCFLLAGTALVIMTAIFAWLVFGLSLIHI